MPVKKTNKDKEAAVKTEPVVKPVKKALEKPKRDLLVPILVGAIIVASFGVGFLYGKVSVYEKLGTSTAGTNQAAAQADDNAQAEAVPTVTADQVKALAADEKNIVFGDTDKKLVFVEFSDPSCPYCHIAGGKNGELNKQVGTRFTLKEDGGTYVAPVGEMKKLVDQGKAAFVWVYSNGHGNGELATQALYCAHEQGKFWQAHDLLMSNKGYDLVNETVQNDLTKIPQLVDFLKGAVNANNLKSCLESKKYAERVSADETIARDFGVRGTPSFFVNEQNFGGAYSFTDMQSAVDAALK